MMKRPNPAVPVSVAALRCACGSTDLVCISPGTDEIREAGILLAAAKPMTGMCLACWPVLIVRPAAPARRKRGRNHA